MAKRSTFTLIAFVILTALTVSTEAAEAVSAREYFGSVFPEECRHIYHNESGSCVYMSVGAAGQYQNCPSASYMPFESIYGAECRGGSWPSRFESDARKRGLNAVSVTGSATYEWMRWAVINGRWAACGCGTAHFQTVVGYDDAGTPEDEDDDSWYVWNCNDVDRAPDTIYKYTDREFKRLHRASGEWCVVLVNIATRPEYPRWKVK